MQLQRLYGDDGNFIGTIDVHTLKLGDELAYKMHPDRLRDELIKMNLNFKRNYGQLDMLMALARFQGVKQDAPVIAANQPAVKP